MNLLKKMYLCLRTFPQKIKMKHKKAKWKKSEWCKFQEPLMVFPETMISGNLGKIILGKKNCIRGIIEVQRPDGEIVIGNHNYIGEGTRIWAAEKIEIGNHVMIAHNCNIFDNDTHPVEYMERRMDSEEIIWGAGRKKYASLKSAPIIIEDDAWICAGATILRGITIGERSIVAAGAIVTKSVPPDTVVAGNPAKVVSDRRYDKE